MTGVSGNLFGSVNEVRVRGLPICDCELFLL